MTLTEVIEQLADLDQEATIYAAKPWRPDSDAVVVMEPDDGRLPVAASGLDYFLEVEMAIEAAQVSNARTRFDRVLHYAENDAFLFDA